IALVFGPWRIGRGRESRNRVVVGGKRACVAAGRSIRTLQETVEGDRRRRGGRARIGFEAPDGVGRLEGDRWLECRRVPAVVVVAVDGEVEAVAWIDLLIPIEAVRARVTATHRPRSPAAHVEIMRGPRRRGCQIVVRLPAAVAGEGA